MVPRAPGARRTLSGGCRYTGDCGRRPGRRTAAAPRRQLVALARRTITRRRNGPARRSRLHPHYAAQRWHATGEPPAVARDRGRAPSMDNPPACIPRSLTSVAACRRVLLQPLALAVLRARGARRMWRCFLAMCQPGGSGRPAPDSALARRPQQSYYRVRAILPFVPRLGASFSLLLRLVRGRAGHGCLGGE